MAVAPAGSDVCQHCRWKRESNQTAGGAMLFTDDPGVLRGYFGRPPGADHEESPLGLNAVRVLRPATHAQRDDTERTIRSGVTSTEVNRATYSPHA